MRKLWKASAACFVMGALALAAANGQAVDEQCAADAELDALGAMSVREFIEGSYGLLMRRDPDSLWDSTGQTAAAYGVERFDRMTDISAAALAETRRLEGEILLHLREFNRDALADRERISYDAYEWLLEDRIALGTHSMWDVGFGPSTFGVQTRQLLLFNALPIRDREDARNYVTRLRATSVWMEQLIAVLAAREAAGALPSLFVIQVAAQDLSFGVLQDDAAVPDPRSAEAYVTFAERLSSLSLLGPSERAALLDEAAAAIRDSVFPAYRRLRDELVRLQGVASPDVGVARYPGGRAYYECVLQHFVGTGASAQELHGLGLSHVARIEAELRDAAFRSFGWPRDLPMAELNLRIQETKTEFLEGRALQAEYDRLVEEAWAALPAGFDALPSAGLEMLIEPSGPPACYVPPPLDGSGPGFFQVSLANPALSVMYDEAVLVYHETIPGHHLQFALALDMDLPTFQSAPIVPLYAQHPAFQAFTEGWALYAEHLAAELGLYDDNPLGNLWRLRLELTRAVRLVADTGMNALGWSWADAAAYLERTLGVAQRQNVLLRYEAAPGQACGYNVGYFTLLALRDRAAASLGDRFDLREFHACVLQNGALPLALFERVVDEWIESGG